MIESSFEMKGEIEVWKDGRLWRAMKNRVVEAGLQAILFRIFGVPYGTMQYMAVGTNRTPVVPQDAKLGTEIARVPFDVIPAQVALNVATARATFGPRVGTGLWAELGIFDTNNPAASTMLNRAVFTPFEKAEGDSLTIIWRITANAS